jgi:hypothetical protein
MYGIINRELVGTHGVAKIYTIDAPPLVRTPFETTGSDNAVSNQLRLAKKSFARVSRLSETGRVIQRPRKR